MRNIQERLGDILARITDPAFCENKGLGNEIGYYIFDYDPKDEWIVREHIVYIKKKINTEKSHLYIREFDLYEIVIEILNKKGFLEKNFEMEKKKGSKFVLNATKKALRLTLKNDLVLQYIEERVQPNDIVFLTGIGKAFPIQSC